MNHQVALALILALLPPVFTDRPVNQADSAHRAVMVMLYSPVNKIIQVESENLCSVVALIHRRE